MFIPISEHLTISRKAALLLEELYIACKEEEVLCTQAPNIWDGDDSEDTRTAKRGCNGVKKTETTIALPPCPLKALCLEAALEAKVTHGVWGGTSVLDRRRIKSKRRKSQL